MAVHPNRHEFDSAVRHTAREQDTDARLAVEGRLPSLDRALLVGVLLDRFADADASLGLVT
ncbi:hypothetical protein [Streptomyces sp. NPDC051704]|uniref:hypothetical protein n=1 Tax=Streptomyces sp. NPDC051704 TaxID=3365671 RepID=UPI0037B87D67